jgi:EAL and modified HD-GYP domain-containing signal transduction protein
MTASALPGKASAPPLDEIGGCLRYVARQPILDIRGRVHAYELLFRAGRETAFRGDSEMATRTMLDNTVMFGMEKLTGGLPAFVNCTREALTEDLVHVLPPDQTVLEILETLEPTSELVDACSKLKIAGFRLALDDFIWHEKFEPLVELADYIKVDFSLTGAAERKRLLKRLSGMNLVLLAEKVETPQEYRQACDEGFTLFQGYYFCRPTLLENRKVPANRISQFQILQMMHSDSLDLRVLTKLVKQDASLTYRLLRLVNSPIFTTRQEVKSIHSALLVVGEQSFRRIATLAITSELSGSQPEEILRMAFLRARFCELAAEKCGMDATEQYLMGLVSLLPAMLRIPMKELTPALPLRKEIRQALDGVHNAERELLAWVECHERANWEACDEVAQTSGLGQGTLMRCYAEALLWSEDALKSVR